MQIAKISRLIGALTLLSITLDASAVSAQITAAAIAGIVTDETGGVLPGVEVAVTNLATGLTRSAVTHVDGSFTIAGLPPGVYDARATLSGFTTTLHRGIQLTVAEQGSLNLRLKVGLSELVVVVARSALVETKSASLSGLWKLQDGAAAELWNGLNGFVSAAPAVSSDGQRIAFPVRKGGRTTLYLMRADGTGARPIAEDLDVNGAPSWSSDGNWIAVAAGQGGNARLFKIPVDGGPSVRLTDDYSVDPVWSPDGRYVVFAGSHVGSSFALKSVTEDGKPRALPTLVAVRGSRLCFVPGRNTLVVVKGQVFHRNFYLVDLDTGRERQLSNLQPELTIQDFEVSPDGREILFTRVKETSDIVLIDLPKP